MNWFIKVSGTQEAFLRSLGVEENIISFVKTLDPKTSSILTNEIRKNPQITLPELQNLSQKLTQKKEVINPYIEVINSIINSPRFLWQHRWRSQTNINDFKKWISNQAFKAFGLRGKTKTDDLTIEKIMNYMQNDSVHLMTDWMENLDENTSIFDYTMDEALAESKKWHETGEKGMFDKYDAISPENIAYGPQWKNEKGNIIPQYQGWTVQRITSENDLKVEGDKMQHCVGSYCHQVKNKQSVIYSLRDPGNEPHVTIETDGSGDTAYQIFGKSNSEPKPEYKTMIKNWIESGKNAPQHYGDEDESLYDIHFSRWGGYREFSQEFENAIEKKISGRDEYGFKQTPVSSGEIEHVFDQAYFAVGELSNYGYNGDRNLSDGLVQLALVGGKDVLEYLFELIQKKEEEVDRYFDLGVPYPQEEDYEDVKEYKKAIENYEREEQDAMDQSFPNGWFADIYKEVRRQLERNYHTTLENFLYTKKETVTASKNWYKYNFCAKN